MMNPKISHYIEYVVSLYRRRIPFGISAIQDRLIGYYLPMVRRGEIPASIFYILLKEYRDFVVSHRLNVTLQQLKRAGLTHQDQVVAEQKKLVSILDEILRYTPREVIDAGRTSWRELFDEITAGTGEAFKQLINHPSAILMGLLLLPTVNAIPHDAQREAVLSNDHMPISMEGQRIYDPVKILYYAQEDAADKPHNAVLTRDGGTILHAYASFADTSQLAELLNLPHNRDIDLDVQDDYGATPLMRAFVEHQRTNVMLLIEHGASFFWEKADGKNDYNLIYAATLVDDRELLLMLRDAGLIDKRNPDAFNMTTLERVVQLNKIGAVKTLLEFGANPMSRFSKESDTALEIAAIEGHEEILTIFEEYGLINARDNHLQTALYVTVLFNKWAAAERLLRHHASPFLPDANAALMPLFKWDPKFAAQLETWGVDYVDYFDQHPEDFKKLLGTLTQMRSAYMGRDASKVAKIDKTILFLKRLSERIWEEDVPVEWEHLGVRAVSRSSRIVSKVIIRGGLLFLGVRAIQGVLRRRAERQRAEAKEKKQQQKKLKKQMLKYINVFTRHLASENKVELIDNDGFILGTIRLEETGVLKDKGFQFAEGEKQLDGRLTEVHYQMEKYCEMVEKSLKEIFDGAVCDGVLESCYQFHFRVPINAEIFQEAEAGKTLLALEEANQTFRQRLVEDSVEAVLTPFLIKIKTLNDTTMLLKKQQAGFFQEKEKYLLLCRDFKNSGDLGRYHEHRQTLVAVDSKNTLLDQGERILSALEQASFYVDTENETNIVSLRVADDEITRVIEEGEKLFNFYSEMSQPLVGRLASQSELPVDHDDFQAEVQKSITEFDQAMESCSLNEVLKKINEDREEIKIAIEKIKEQKAKFTHYIDRLQRECESVEKRRRAVEERDRRRAEKEAAKGAKKQKRPKRQPKKVEEKEFGGNPDEASTSSSESEHEENGGSGNPQGTVTFFKSGDSKARQIFNEKEVIGIYRGEERGADEQSIRALCREALTLNAHYLRHRDEPGDVSVYIHAELFRILRFAGAIHSFKPFLKDYAKLGNNVIHIAYLLQVAFGLEEKAAMPVLFEQIQEFAASLREEFLSLLRSPEELEMRDDPRKIMQRFGEGRYAHAAQGFRIQDTELDRTLRLIFQADFERDVNVDDLLGLIDQELVKLPFILESIDKQMAVRPSPPRMVVLAAHPMEVDALGMVICTIGELWARLVERFLPEEVDKKQPQGAEYKVAMRRLIVQYPELKLLKNTLHACRRLRNDLRHRTELAVDRDRIYQMSRSLIEISRVVHQLAAAQSQSVIRPSGPGQTSLT